MNESEAAKHLKKSIDLCNFLSENSSSFQDVISIISTSLIFFAASNKIDIKDISGIFNSHLKSAAANELQNNLKKFVLAKEKENERKKSLYLV